MNATNYYVSTTRLVLQADPDSPPSWQDLYTALPTLRSELWKITLSRIHYGDPPHSGPGGSRINL